jgi:hypothetical protein
VRVILRRIRLCDQEERGSVRLTESQREAIFAVLTGDVSPEDAGYEFLADLAARDLWRIERILEGERKEVGAA